MHVLSTTTSLFAISAVDRPVSLSFQLLFKWLRVIMIVCCIGLAFDHFLASETIFRCRVVLHARSIFCSSRCNFVVYHLWLSYGMQFSFFCISLAACCIAQASEGSSEQTGKAFLRGLGCNERDDTEFNVCLTMSLG